MGVLLGLGATGQPNKFTLTGTITMQTGEQFPYKIVGTETNGVVKGFAYTYAEPDETKAAIEGKLDKQGRKLSFKETEIISSHDVHTKAFMCLVHAKLDYKANALSGPATSKELDNTACTEGVISFNKGTELQELFSSHDKYDVEVSMGGKAAKEVGPAPAVVAAVAEEAPKLDKITAGVEKAYEWHTDTVIVEIWDGGTFDGDKVTVTFDDVPVIKKYTLQKTKKRLAIALPATGVHYLSIYAEDEGSDPPNTATLTLTDGTKRYNLVAYNPKGAQSLVQVRRVGK